MFFERGEVLRVLKGVLRDLFLRKSSMKVERGSERSLLAEVFYMVARLSEWLIFLVHE